ncbi:MAG: thioredoxin family protein [Bacteroidales bacterium]|nr:thioredoxin family protein [Bacteroidales bacterium]
MKRSVQHLAMLLLLLIAPWSIAAQQLNPSHWTYTVENVSAESADLCFTVKLDEGWHIYSTRTDDGGPLPTEFAFNPSSNYTLNGGIAEPKPHEAFDDIFKVTVRDFANQVTFRQKIKRNTAKAFKVEGTLSFQLCNNGSCIAPEDRPFVFEIAEATPPATASAAATDKEPSQTMDTSLTTPDTAAEADSNQPVIQIIDEPSEKPAESGQSLWLAFLLAFVAGLLTMITPCVFPMVPMTVNYFVHGGQRNQAWIFGLSIVLIFAVLGALLTLIFGPEALYFLGTHWIPNLLFFVIFLLFSLSFFGLFEIQLPSRWVNKSDQQADRGGWLAPFFMALTTVLVSFSCTGPILGAALVGLTTSTTNAWVSLVTMLGFGIGFALPFTLLALFPQWLKGLKSGDWLNTIKITFAFLELAFGLKFLSMADLYCNWHLLDREVYLALWIVIFALLGCYLLGAIRFKGDSEAKHLSVGRLFTAILVFAFVVYMIPGLFGAPLKAISGFLPPMGTQDFNIERLIHEHAVPASDGRQDEEEETRRYADQLHLPTGFDGYFDLEEAKSHASITGKPIFIDFTGKTCANCREMEHYVWNDPAVKQLLNEEFVICALYVDENTIFLPEEEWMTTDDGRVLKTLGRVNLEYEKSAFNMNAQPYYVIVDPTTGDVLTTKNYQYNRNPRKFEAWLNEGLGNFKQNYRSHYEAQP